ncbi:hypothetical protein [Nocardia terpenica]|uniref:Uncharacterized protein n=1 Tax=Nocardia terpenica TaxID=455432 RepID=A0A6G9ZAA2_9NOCA|nr:hypothetical protein [Nocardia terpenica]QIS22340.1 hypothetical protein F6W96_32375 [Nocardia terpenica]
MLKDRESMGLMRASGAVVGVAALTAAVLAQAVAAAEPSDTPSVQVDRAQIDGAFVVMALTYSCPTQWADADKRDARLVSAVVQGGVRADFETRDLWCDGEPHAVYTNPFGGGGWRRFKPGDADVEAQLYKGSDMRRVPEAEHHRSLQLG